VLSILLFALGIFSLVALAHLTPGALSDGWAGLLRLLFGWGAFGAPLGLGLAGWLAFQAGRGRKMQAADWLKVGAAGVGFVSTLAALHSWMLWADPWQLASEGGGGGVVGWALSSLVAIVMPVPLLGRILAALVFTLVAASSVFLAVRLCWQNHHYVSGKPRVPQLSHELAGLRTRVVAWASWAESQLAALAATSAWSAPTAPRRLRIPLRTMPQSMPVAAAKPTATVAAVTPTATRASPSPRLRRSQRLPPLSLLADGSGTEISVQEDETHRKAVLIEQTLTNFGLAGRVVEVSQGPAVTQFGVEPGFVERGDRTQKVRVGQIASLQDDLALALSARTLRIQAPIPGKNLVGIEVPNEETATVSLLGILQSKEFRGMAGKPLAVAMGRDVAGGAISADLATMPHLLIAGTTGSGKSVCINAIITCLVMSNQPEDLRLVMIDPKMVELIRWNGLPHLLGKVETDLERVGGVLRWVTREMDSRYKKFAEAGSRNIADYNEKTVERDDRLPHIVVVVDELADLMMTAGVEVEKTICRLAQMARATGIHLVIATQRPSTDVVTGLIKANFPARIAFAVASATDSRVILDGVGAETLLGKGDMLYLASDAGHPVRVQGCFVSDAEIDAVVQFWQSAGGAAPVDAPWETELAAMAAVSRLGNGDANDGALMQQAIELVKTRGGASASLLQRRLRIGYPKAARMIDQMEEMGIIGPPEGAGRMRKLIAKG
jgi:S-DNA-T family DNA segregation ATPase FtsK/SpoIIIE